MSGPSYPEEAIGEQLRSPPIRPLDLTGRERHLRSALTAMDRIGQAFARYARRSMPFLVRHHARIVAGTTQVSGTVETDPLEEPTFAIHVGPTDAQAWGSIVLNAYAVAITLEGALGGAPNANPVMPTGDPSPAQRALLNRVARSLAVDFCNALQEEVGLAWKPIPADANPAVIPTSSDAITLACPIEGLSFPAKIALMAAAEALEAAAREQGNDGDGVQTDPRLVDAMREVPVDLVAELGRVKMGLRRVLSLRVGDVIRLRTAVEDPVSVQVGGVEKFQAMPVLSRGQIAIEVRTRRPR